MAEITKELLEEKAKGLLAQREQLVANLNAVEGALQMIGQLTDALDGKAAAPNGGKGDGDSSK